MPNLYINSVTELIILSSAAFFIKGIQIESPIHSGFRLFLSLEFFYDRVKPPAEKKIWRRKTMETFIVHKVSMKNIVYTIENQYIKIYIDVVKNLHYSKVSLNPG